MSSEYDYELIQMTIEELHRAIAAQDYYRLWSLLKTCLVRDYAGIDNPSLYCRTHTGTKYLIERYQECLKDSLQAFVHLHQQQAESRGGKKALLERLMDLRHHLGCTGLFLSGGGMLSWHHAGVLRALYEENLVPKVFIGSSGGAITAATFSRHTNCGMIGCCSEINNAFPIDHVRVDDFLEDKDQPWPLWLVRLLRLFRTGTILNSTRYQQNIKFLFGETVTFLEAFQQSGIVLNISVSHVSDKEMPSVLNYLTAPDVLIWSAALASGSPPLLFKPAVIWMKDSRTGLITSWDGNYDGAWRDGSIFGDIPKSRLAELFNVTHSIVCQVNPHMNPLLRIQEMLFPAISSRRKRRFGLWGKILKLLSSEIDFRLDQIVYWLPLPDMLIRFINFARQPWSGDITIIPQIPAHHFPYAISDCPEWLIQEADQVGRLAAYRSTLFKVFSVLTV